MRKLQKKEAHGKNEESVYVCKLSLPQSEAVTGVFFRNDG
jgi:hypothetical protein